MCSVRMSRTRDRRVRPRARRASFRDRWCCWAASQASASLRSCSRRQRISRARSVPSSTPGGRNRSTRSRAAAIASARRHSFFDCETGFQGITPGWVDQYHQSTDGQQLTITGAPEGTYYWVSTTNHEGIFFETDQGNNTSWVVLDLTRHSNGNPKLKITGNACDDAYYLPKLQAAIADFTSDPDLQTAIEDDMCGGGSANR